MAIKKKYQALGRGLDALISTEEVKTGGSSSISEVRIELIHPNPNQPRREFDDDSLQELANSIRQIGVIQPITLRDMGDGLLITSVQGLHSGANQISGDFSLGAKGFLIENGRMTQPIKDINIIGNGPEALADIVAVAADSRIDDSTWTCGKDQYCPVSCGMPSVLVKSLIVGGDV